jgi:hypothetical protein
MAFQHHFFLFTCQFLDLIFHLNIPHQFFVKIHTFFIQNWDVYFALPNRKWSFLLKFTLWDIHKLLLLLWDSEQNLFCSMLHYSLISAYFFYFQLDLVGWIGLLPSLESTWNLVYWSRVEGPCTFSIFVLGLSVSGVHYGNGLFIYSPPSSSLSVSLSLSLSLFFFFFFERDSTAPGPRKNYQKGWRFPI